MERKRERVYTASYILALVKQCVQNLIPFFTHLHTDVGPSVLWERLRVLDTSRLGTLQSENTILLSRPSLFTYYFLRYDVTIGNLTIL